MNKHKILKRVLSAVFAVSVGMSNVVFDFSSYSNIMEVSANDVDNFTLDYTGNIGYTYPQIENGVLKLEDFTFNTTADVAIKVPRGTTIEFSGTNTITSGGVGILSAYDPEILRTGSNGWDLVIEGDSKSTLTINAEDEGIYVENLGLALIDADIEINAGTGIYMEHDDNTDFTFNIEKSNLDITADTGCGIELKRILGTSVWEDSDITIDAKTIGISIDGNGGDGFVDSVTIDDCNVDITADGNSSIYLVDVNNFEVTGCDQFDLTGGNNGIQAVGSKLYFKKTTGEIEGDVNGIFSIENPNDLRQDKGSRLIEFDGGDMTLIGGTSAFKTDLSYDTSADEIMFNADVFPYIENTDYKATLKEQGDYTQMYDGDSIAIVIELYDNPDGEEAPEEGLDDDATVDPEGDSTEPEEEEKEEEPTPEEKGDFFNITFKHQYPDGGTYDDFTKQTNSEATLNKEDFYTPSYDGYTFKGWYLGQVSHTDNDLVSNGYTFKADISIYAQWEKIVPAVDAMIHFNANGGSINTASSNVSTTTINTNSDGKISLLPNATREGYTFMGWYDGDNLVSTSTVYSKSTYLIAKWQETAYITFHYAYTGQDDVTRAVGSTGTVIGGFPTVNNRENIVFLGWFDSSGKKVEDGATFSSTQTLTANWTTSYTITFDPVLSLLEPPTQSTNADGKLDSLPKMLCPGYGLSGWYTKEEGGELVTASTVFKEDTTLYARWISDEFTVTFKPDYTGSVEFTVATEDYKLKTLPNAPARSGYEFQGWYTKQNGSGTKLTSGYEVEEDMIVYALWADSDNVYNDNYSGSGLEAETGVVTISLDAQHDSYDDFDDIKTNEFGRLTKYPGILVSNGMAFDGWYTGKNGTGEKVYEDTKFINDMTIYGNWIEGEVTVTINQDYSGSFEIPYATSNNRLSTLPSPKVRPGYTFEGWYWVSTGSGSNDATLRDMSIGLGPIIKATTETVTGSALDSAVTTSTTFSNDATIYASWSVIEGGTIIVSFDSNGGTPGYYLDQTGIDGRLSSLPTPTREGYTFLGWFDGNLEISNSYIFRFDTEVYARWQLDTEVEAENNHNTGGNVMYQRDIPTLERLYVDKFQNLLVGDYITGLGSVSPNRPDLGVFVGWYHGSSLSRPLDYFELQSILVTEELFITGIYPKFEKNIVSTGGTSSSNGGAGSTNVPETNTNTKLSRLF